MSSESNIRPISDRTDESLVRTIAKWMGLKHDGRWNSFSQWLVIDGIDNSFSPQLDADDRERVMIYMGISVSWTFDYETVILTDCEIEPQHEEMKEWSVETTYGGDKTFERAFCEAAVMWIEEQDITQ